jgi:hypothetical protein
LWNILQLLRHGARGRRYDVFARRASISAGSAYEETASKQDALHLPGVSAYTRAIIGRALLFGQQG